MAHRHETNYEPPQLTMNRSTHHVPPRLTAKGTLADEDEVPVDVDEPPENQLRFDRKSLLSSNPASPIDAYLKVPTSPVPTTNSLLTQALHSNSQLASTATSPMFPTIRAPSTASAYSTTSVTSTAELTSDGEMTSPARSASPSPPLPVTIPSGFLALTPKNLLGLKQEPCVHQLEPTRQLQIDAVDQKPWGEVPAPRKRCIMFAGEKAKDDAPVMERKPAQNDAPKAEIPKRPCMLKFMCPSKPQRNDESLFAKDARRSAQETPLNPVKIISPLLSPMGQANSSIAQEPGVKSPSNIGVSCVKEKKYKPEGMRFHEFAGGFDQDEEWIRAQPTMRQKLTVNDTLRKELAIRKLAEEAEEEADEEDQVGEEGDELPIEDVLEENDDNDEDEDEDEDEEDDNDEEGDAEEEDSDGGNESDNEEGFADSDNESDFGSEYHFWTPGVTTAATSTDHLDHIRSRSQRRASVSSIDSIVKAGASPASKRRLSGRRNSSSKRSLKFRPGTPDLPDSTDFVCGTLDEDRPMEAAYMSCLEQRRRFKQPFVPQDVDPSFPSSDLDEEDEDPDDMNTGSVEGTTDDEHLMFTGHIGEHGNARGRRPSVTKLGQNRLHSPPPTKRLRSPPPPAKHRQPHRSPPPPKYRYHSPPPTIRGGPRSPPAAITAPRPLFNSPTRLCSSPPHPPKSPPSSRHPSPSSHGHITVPVPHLAQRATLTHTKSLPRTPNPFYAHAHHYKSSHHTQHHKHANTRGPIAIVQGLDMKRARRREKYYRQQQLCKEKAWRENKGKGDRCAPGLGVQRMRTLGLEVQERCRGYGIKLGGAAVLSI